MIKRVQDLDGVQITPDPSELDRLMRRGLPQFGISLGIIGEIGDEFAIHQLRSNEALVGHLC